MRRNTYQYMDVVRTCFCLYYLHILLLAQFPQYLSNIFFQLTIYLFPSVFRCNNYMIFATIF